MTSQLKLGEQDHAALNGEFGGGVSLAMGLLIAIAEADGATKFIDIEGAHIDGCLFHGQAGIDFVKALVEGGARARVPTTLNVSSLDLLHPELYLGSTEDAAAARKLMDLHVELGCSPTWTCAPYQLAHRPSLGSQIAWGESNAIVFANSVLGARTNRYGDFADLACSVTGRAPYSGLHTDAGRLADLVVEVDLPESSATNELLFPLLGYWLGSKVGTSIPAIVGLGLQATEDDLKALGAAAASSGSTAMFHAVGITPEAPTLAACLRDKGAPRFSVGLKDLQDARLRLGVGSGKVGAVSLGTPHMSIAELQQLAEIVVGRTTKVPFYVNTGRDTLAGASESVVSSLSGFGATVVTDTCTYITPIMASATGPVMTNSGKWAYYAPGNLGIDVVLGGLEECVKSAETGQIRLSDPFVT